MQICIGSLLSPLLGIVNSILYVLLLQPYLFKCRMYFILYHKNMKKRNTLWMLFACLLTIAWSTSTAQTARITGVVTDAANNEPLIGASAFIEQLKTGEVTDAKGNFSIQNLPPGTYTVRFDYMGYESHSERVTLREGEVRRIKVQLQSESKSLSEVVVTAKSEARQLREQAMPISVISMNQLSGTVAGIADILSKTVGVTLRSSGGVGGATRLSVRGLEGKRIGFFIDETPMNDNSDFIDINDIPIDMIDRIEIYKGVVPAKFGGSAMGGAVNLVLKEYPARYADFSYTLESFNTHKVQTVLKRNLRNQGLVFGIGGGYTYSDNNYTMLSPYVDGLKIRRDHDGFRKLILGGSLKAYKWWFDKVEIEPAFALTNHEIQGIEKDIRKAETHSMLFALANKLEKKNFLTPGLDFDMHLAAAITSYGLVDTAKQWYDWDGRAYPSPSIYGGELGNRYASHSSDKKFTISHKLNLEYLLHKQHSLNFNSLFTLANGFPKDSLRELSIGREAVFNSRMRSWSAGLTYDFRTPKDRLLNSLTVRYYLYTMKTRQADIFGIGEVHDVDVNKSAVGVNDALRFRILPDLMAKLSAGYDVRIPSETELLGDGYTVSPAENLMPERNTSLNVGFLYDLTGRAASNLQIEVNAFYMYLQHMIRYTKGILGAQYQNFGEMRTMGVEAEVKADITPWLYGYANATFQDLRDVREHDEGSSLPNPTKGLRMPNIPYLMGNAGLEFHHENLFGGRGQNTRLFSDLSFVEEYLYDFEMAADQRRIPRSTTVDLGLEHSFFNNSLFLSAKIKNLTDARVLSEFNRPLPGRSFGVKVRYVFK